ncbi:hypothetical protein GE09DRAFT_172646 [Coniochaeta sp. 2T2.1]|nr:hypothetical protein GE09DRAFT_172646 [Coniochaeta sp. 2T2.1]
MIDQPRSKIIEENPIGKGLDVFRASFNSMRKGPSISCTPDALERLGPEELDPRSALSTARPSGFSSALLQWQRQEPLQRSIETQLSCHSDDFDLDSIKPLLNAALADDPNDALIWDRVYHAVTECTPPPRPIASSLQQTPWLRNTSSFANSSEHRKHVDDLLKEELGPMYVGLRNFHDTYFGDVADLEAASETFFKQCVGGNDPLFHGGWKGWPKDANQDDVLSWFEDFSEKLAAFGACHKSIPTRQRRPLAKPNEPIDGSVAKRKMDVGFVNDPKAGKDSRCHWDQILVPGELKSNRSADRASEAWLDLGRYAREVLAAQDTRRFVLGFTICDSLMRVWVFDRLGGIASDQFDKPFTGDSAFSWLFGTSPIPSSSHQWSTKASDMFRVRSRRREDGIRYFQRCANDYQYPITLFPRFGNV